MVATVLTVYGIETFKKRYYHGTISYFRVATVLTVYGIETFDRGVSEDGIKLQQYLPFTVLKHNDLALLRSSQVVATVLTVYGIETRRFPFNKGLTLSVATVLTVYGIETI